MNIIKNESQLFTSFT